MKGIWQAAAWLVFANLALAAERDPFYAWKSPEIGRGIFTQDLGMLDSERDEYATNLAVHAANVVVVNRFSGKSLMEARRLLALAFHLSPRNKKAVVLNYQLGRSIIPEAKPGDYSPEVFARIILTRGQLLLKQPGEQNQIAGRFFIQLAAELDPRNDDAVYASEVQRLDGGALKWETITDVKSD